MSEKHHAQRIEHGKSTEHRVEFASNAPERTVSTTEKQHGNTEQLDSIIEKVEHLAVSGAELAPGERENGQHFNHPVFVNKNLKDIAFSRTITRTRKKLSAPSRAFSKVVHNNAVDRSSDFVGRTVARPPAMLGGAFFAFVGTSILLWATRKYGYEYNYLVMLLLFVFGTVFGNIVELVLRRIRSQK